MRWMLLVEDEPDHRVLVREALRRLGEAVELHEVGDAAEAMAWLGARTGTPGGVAHGVVVLDLGLPGPSGFELLEWMRERQPLAGLPVVVLTASENPLDAEHAFNLGARGYFQKPTDFSRYETIFRRTLGIAARASEGGDEP